MVSGGSVAGPLILPQGRGAVNVAVGESRGGTAAATSTHPGLPHCGQVGGCYRKKTTVTSRKIGTRTPSDQRM